MYKVQTQLSHFRFNSTHNKGPYTVTWFKVTEGENENEMDSSPFSTQEVNQVTNYFANNKINFDNQNYFKSDLDEPPYISEVFPAVERHPGKLIIRNHVPDMRANKGEIFNTMEIELLKPNGATNHNYSLPFSIVGVIET